MRVRVGVRVRVRVGVRVRVRSEATPNLLQAHAGAEAAVKLEHDLARGRRSG